MYQFIYNIILQDLMPGINNVIRKFQGHHSSVHYLDWSKDSRYLQTVSEDHAILSCK